MRASSQGQVQRHQQTCGGRCGLQASATISIDTTLRCVTKQIKVIRYCIVYGGARRHHIQAGPAHTALEAKVDGCARKSQCARVAAKVKGQIARQFDLPMLALPKKRPLLVEDEGGGGLWICDAVGARDWRMLYVRCILSSGCRV